MEFKNKKKKESKEEKKILESKNIIKEEKKKIKLERLAIRKRKRDKFKKTKLGRILLVFSGDANDYSFSEVFVITIVSLLIGAFACFSVFTFFTGGRNYFKIYKQFNKFFDVYQVLAENYYGDVDKDKLIDSAINGMVSSVGDVYTSYNDVDTALLFNDMVSGIYEGIGCTIQQLDNEITIIDVYDGSPAYKAGLKNGDIIKSVDKLDGTKVKVNELSEYIKNEAQGKITMVIIRDNEEKTFTLERGKVEIPTVSSKVFTRDGKKIGYINISIFSSVSAKQFKNKLLALEDEGIDSLIIDVRDNSGGYLSSVTDIASYLLPKGKVIYQVQKGNKKEKTQDKTSEKREYPIAILVNKNSASASEILAAVIKESYQGDVVGVTTYGKGTVQQVKKLSDGSMVKYTIENWLTPLGNWINEKGIEPTDKVELSENYFKNPNDENDNQLQKALELVTK